MKSIKQIRAEIRVLKRLALSCPKDRAAQASIASQINILEWVIGS